MKSKQELLKIFLNNTADFRTGLCNWTGILWIKNLISEKEYDFLSELIDSNPTKKYKSVNELYFWKKGNINPRIKFLKKHLS